MALPHQSNGDLISATIWNTMIDEINAIRAALYPVGSIYTNASSSTNPGTLLGFGTWVAFGTGRVLVGIDAGQTEFDTIGETGGAKTHTLIEQELPPHSHVQKRSTAGGGSTTDFEVASNRNTTYTNAPSSTATAGSGWAHNNLQPYVVVYMWQRTA